MCNVYLKHFQKDRNKKTANGEKTDFPLTSCFLPKRVVSYPRSDITFILGDCRKMITILATIKLHNQLFIILNLSSTISMYIFLQECLECTIHH